MRTTVQKATVSCVKAPTVSLIRPAFGRLPGLVNVQQQRSSSHVVHASTPILEEEDRKLWRSVYDHRAWQKHRSPYRLYDRLQQLPNSGIIRNILPTIFWVATVSAFVVAYTDAYDAHLLPEFFPMLAPNAACRAFINTTSVALSLLLVFRTNASYGRWDEARKLWGGLVNRSRDISRQAAVMFPEDNPEAKKQLGRWMIAFTRSLRCFLQPEVTLDSELKNILSPEELAMLKGSVNPPIKAIHALSQVVRNAKLDPVSELQMSQNLTFFHDVLGGCERLLRAPIPVSYTRHTARFLFVWMTLLPFTIEPVGWWDIPVVVGIAAVLAAIEEIGVQCEEPFGILPLDVISNRIQTDVTNTLLDDGATRATLGETIWWDPTQPDHLSPNKPKAIAAAMVSEFKPIYASDEEPEVPVEQIVREALHSTVSETRREVVEAVREATREAVQVSAFEQWKAGLREEDRKAEGDPQNGIIVANGMNGLPQGTVFIQPTPVVNVQIVSNNQ